MLYDVGQAQSASSWGAVVVIWVTRQCKAVLRSGTRRGMEQAYIWSQAAPWDRVATDRSGSSIRESGDTICILYGCSVPVVLRKHSGDDGKDSYWELIRDAYAWFYGWRRNPGSVIGYAESCSGTIGSSYLLGHSRHLLIAPYERVTGLLPSTKYAPFHLLSQIVQRAISSPPAWLGRISPPVGVRIRDAVLGVNVQ